MKGYLLLAEHITIGVNGMYNALNAGFTQILVPASHPPDTLYEHQCALLIGFRAEDGNDEGRHDYRLMLEHPEYEPVPIFNGQVTVPVNGSIYTGMPGRLILQYPTSYALRLYIKHFGLGGRGDGPEWVEIEEYSFSVSRVTVPHQVGRPGQKPGMAPFGAQPGIPPSVVLQGTPAHETETRSGEEADIPPLDYDPTEDLEGIDWGSESDEEGKRDDG